MNLVSLRTRTLKRLGEPGNEARILLRANILIGWAWPIWHARASDLRRFYGIPKRTKLSDT